MQSSRLTIFFIGACALACTFVQPCQGQACSPPDWLPSGFCTALDGSVTCSAIYDDGFGPKLYVGGSFTTTGGAVSTGVVSWDGTSWAMVGGGLAGTVSTLCVHDDGFGPALYAGGFFTVPGMNIARWNGASWAAVGTGFNNAVTCLASYNDGTGPGLYAGGWFSSAGPNLTNRIGKWDGVAWASVGTGTNGSGVQAFAVFNNALYVAGAFTNAGGVPATNLATWNGAWGSIGIGPNGAINDFAVWDDGTGPALYAGGQFTMINGVSASRIVKFDGTTWSPLGTGLSSFCYGVRSHFDGFTSDLYATGFFDIAGGVTSPRIAKWTGTTWVAMGLGITGGVGRMLASYNDPTGPMLFVGGNFPTVNGFAAPNVAKWGPAPPAIVAQPASQVVNAGANVTFTVGATGLGNAYQWNHNGGPITGATTPTLNLTAVSPIDWGIYDCVVSNGCGTVTSAVATLALNPAFTLTMSQPFGSLSLYLAHSAPAQPGAAYLTTFSFDSLNSLQPGQGPWAGMFVSFNEIVNQFLYLFPPFVGTLDAGGNALFLLSSGQLPVSLFGVTVCAVSMTFNPSPISLINNSNLQLITIN